MNKKYVVYILIFFGLCVAGAYIGRYAIESNTPPFITDKLKQLKENKIMMDSIGGFKYFEYTYNKNDFRLGDTVKYSITIKGENGILNFKATQLKTRDTWAEIKRDLRIENK